MKKSYLFLILILFAIELTFAQKSITVICVNKLDSCGAKALKIFDNKVQIDNCFNNKNKIFTIKKTTEIKNNLLFAQLINTKVTKWKQIENDLNKIENCDYPTIFEIIVSENNSVNTFNLKRISNCYPPSSKQILEGLDNYFNNEFLKANK